MPPRPASLPAETAAYHGEVWRAGRGSAPVGLPAEAILEPPLEYEFCDLEPASSARLTAGLKNGRFTVATEQPHVKVAWRVSGPSSASHRRHRQQEEE